MASRARRTGAEITLSCGGRVETSSGLSASSAKARTKNKSAIQHIVAHIPTSQQHARLLKRADGSERVRAARRAERSPARARGAVRPAWATPGQYWATPRRVLRPHTWCDGCLYGGRMDLVSRCCVARAAPGGAAPACQIGSVGLSLRIEARMPPWTGTMLRECPSSRRTGRKTRGRRSLALH